ncbi:MAG: hypothetical protein WDW38_008489 [Sanguina aurantia]
MTVSVSFRPIPAGGVNVYNDLLPARLSSAGPLQGLQGDRGDHQEGTEEHSFPHVVGDPELASFAVEVAGMWKHLSRQVCDDVRERPDRHTLLPLPYPFIIPGDRFRECYNWDSYWIILGLLSCDLVGTAEGLLLNLLYLVQRLGFAPNGARSYYTNRSQPPLLGCMVRAVWEAKGGDPSDPLLAAALPQLLACHRHWTTGHKVVGVTGSDGQRHGLSRYYAAWDRPRPESYREDIETARAAGLDDGSKEAAQLWRDLASAAESGWDFSSRWLAESGDLGSIRTTQILPADLNALLYKLELDISFIATTVGDRPTATLFDSHAANRKLAMQQLMCTTAASNWIPLWAGLANPGSPQSCAAVASLLASGLLREGGIMATLHNTGQHPANSGAPGAEEIAAQQAELYCRCCRLAFAASGHMHEKYDGLRPGQVGGGGEYATCVGFGWSNGVLLDLMQKHGAGMVAAEWS